MQICSYNKLIVVGYGSYRSASRKIVSGNQVPGIRNYRGGVVITHKEYIGDITSSSDFKLQLAQNINPSNFVLFPWLSTIAQNFEEYEFKGLVFEYKTMSSASILSSTSTALGTVMMGTEYDILDGNFENKVQMNNHQWSSSTKPSMNMLHVVETKKGRNVLNKQFCRDYTKLVSDTNVDDPRFYDLGIFQVATQGMQAAVVGSTIGEIWASYQIKFFKPQIQAGANTLFQQRTHRNSYDIPTFTTFTLTWQRPLEYLTALPLSGVGLTNTWTGKQPVVTIGTSGPGNTAFTFNPSVPDGYYFFSFRIWFTTSNATLANCVDNYTQMPGPFVFVSAGNNVQVFGTKAESAWSNITSTGINTVSYTDLAPYSLSQVASNTANVAGGKHFIQNWIVLLNRQGDGTADRFDMTTGNNYGTLAPTVTVTSLVESLIVMPIDSSLVDSLNLVNSTIGT